MLSSDLEMLRREMANNVNAQGELTLSPVRTELVAVFLKDCVVLAKQLEANAVRQPSVLIDVSDPKIELFPKAKRPVPKDAPVGVIFFGIDPGGPDGDGAA